MSRVISISDFFPNRIEVFKAARMSTDLFYNLVFVATSDGILHEKEVEVLMKEAEACGVGADIAHEMLRFPEELRFAPPRTEDEKKTFLLKLVNMAFADGDLSVHEMEVINNKRIELGLSKTYLDMLLKLNLERRKAV